MGIITVTPRGKGFWIEEIAKDGSRTLVERVATEDEALRRLKGLRERAEAIEIKNFMRGRRGRF
jgi:hypothetical protein